MRAAFVTVLLLLAATAEAAALPDFADVKAQHARSDALLLDRHGQVIHELRVDASVRRLEWVALDEVSPALVDAVLQAEDRRFHQHGGVDWRALTAAALRALWSDHPRGASTLSMQLAAWLDPALKPARVRRTFAQKWDQIQAARRLEAHWSKAQILEAYLNLVYFRGELQGIAAASRGLFDKQPSGLDRNEALLLAALLRAPNAAVETVAARACRLGENLAWPVACDAVGALAVTQLNGPPRVRPVMADAPHVARALLKPGDTGASSTLDGGLQRYATAALLHQLRSLGDARVKDGAVLVADIASGEVLAYVGNGGGSYVDGVQALRQAGSTLKPFLYAMAIERRLLTAASVLDDAPVNLTTPTGLYVPRNYDNEFRGPTSLRMSLGSSLNVPAVRTLMLVGADPFVLKLRELGFSALTESGDFYGFSLALGSGEVSLWQLVNAFRTLANGGKHSELTLTRQQGDPSRRVFSRDASFIIADVLADRAARSLTFGLDNVLSTPYWSAVKTGTSKDMRDNWCIGFSDRYVVGAWVGNFDGSAMQNVSGVTGAAPLWLDVMNTLHQGRPSRRPSPPTGVIATQTQFIPAVESPRREWFLRGTEAAEIRLPTRSDGQRARIVYPADGTLLALDPDIPPANQRVFFEIAGPQGEYLLRLDQNALTQPETGWQPQPGRHRLVLLDAQGAVMDEAEFEVRGARGSRR